MTVALRSSERAAAILVCLGVERAAQVLEHLPYDMVQQLVHQIVNTGRIAPTMRNELIDELQYRYNTASDNESAGGLSFVRHILTETFGAERAAMVLEQLEPNRARRPFLSLRSADPPRILDVLASEHPGIIALVLYYLPRDKSALVLGGLPDNVRRKVVLRLINLQPPIPQAVTRIDELLTKRLTEARFDNDDGNDRDTGDVIGTRALVEILGQAHPAIERRVYEFLQTENPELAEEVRKSMFVFEDISKLESRALQLVLREMPNKDLAVALKGASPEIRQLVYANVSENAAKMIDEELQLLGPIRVSLVEEAQQSVVTLVRKLAEEGTISLHVGGQQEELIN